MTTIDDCTSVGVDDRPVPWFLGPQRRLVLGALRGDEQAGHAAGDEAGVGQDGPAGLGVAGCYARQADELAAMVEAELAAEHADHAAQVAALVERHQQRVTALGVLAHALGEQHGRLDELAHQLRTAPVFPSPVPASPAPSPVQVPVSVPAPCGGS